MSDEAVRSDVQERLEIQNVVASTAVEQELNLDALASDLEGADYDPDRFPGLIYRTQEPKATSLIFRSGKIVCTGSKSVAGVHEVLDHVFDRLGELGISVSDTPDFVIQNVVTSGDLGQRLNLNALAIGLGLANIEYEPEQFPGLIYRLDEPDVVVLLFGTGKTVITGGETTEDAERAMETLVARLGDLDMIHR